MEPGTEDWADKVTLEGVHKLHKKIQGTCNAIKKSQFLKSSFLKCQGLNINPSFKIQIWTGRQKGLKIRGCQYYLVGIICPLPPLVAIELTDLPKSGGHTYLQPQLGEKKSSSILSFTNIFLWYQDYLNPGFQKKQSSSF